MLLVITPAFADFTCGAKTAYRLHTRDGTGAQGTPRNSQSVQQWTWGGLVFLQLQAGPFTIQIMLFV